MLPSATIMAMRMVALGDLPTTLHYVASHTTYFNPVSTSLMIPSSLAKQLCWVVAGEAISNYNCNVKIALDNIIPVTTKQQNKYEITHLLENTTYTPVIMMKQMHLV
jgi:hypothetical protein